MIYIYDILLNFNNEFYEFYEWNKNDNITICKKISLLKVNSNIYNDLLLKNVQISDPIILDLKSEIVVSKRIKYIKYMFLVTDGYRVLGIYLNQDFKVNKLSDLQLEEANDVINISKRCKILNLTYNIIDNRENNMFLTRDEIKIKKYITNELNHLMLNKDIEKLKYLYFEYFNKNSDNINYYQELLDTLNNNLTKEHLKLYKLIKLIYSS